MTVLLKGKNMNVATSTGVVLSNDNDFVLMVQSSEFSLVASHGKKIEYSFRSNSTDVKDLADHDAVIYDLDLADGNMLQAKNDILHLKINSRSKPLILVGQKKFMQALFDTGTVSQLIDRKVAKPVILSHLEMLINAAIIDYTAKQPVIDVPKEKNTAFGSGFVSAIGSAFGINGSSQHI